MIEMQAFMPCLNQSRLPGVDWVTRVIHRLSMPSLPASSESVRAGLIGAIAASADRSAFIALYEFYAPRIKAQAIRFGLDSATADDVAQETMLAVWRRASQFDASRGTASAWVFTIATNARLDRLRRDKRLAMAADIDECEPLQAAEPDEFSTDSSRLAEIVSALPVEQKRIIQMSFYADIPHAEIASRLGVPLGTVKSRIRLAMTRLRQALGEKP